MYNFFKKWLNKIIEENSLINGVDTGFVDGDIVIVYNNY